MSNVISSEVAHLLYRTVPTLNFAHAVSDICTAFTPASGAPPILSWDCDDIAVIDFRAARVVIGLSENLPGRHAACITVAAGQSPLNVSIDFAKPEQLLLCQAVANRLNQRFPCDAKKVQTYDHPLTSDLIDAVIDILFDTAEEPQKAQVPDQMVTQTLVPVATQPATDLGDMNRLLTRLSAELTQRPQSLITRAIACVTPPMQVHNASTLASAPISAITTSEVEPSGQRSPKSAVGLFWKQTQPNRTADLRTSKQPHRRIAYRGSLTELQAVRDALYAEDQSHGAALSRVAAQTKLALHSIAALPHGVASIVADRWHDNMHSLETRIKH